MLLVWFYLTICIHSACRCVHEPSVPPEAGTGAAWRGPRVVRVAHDGIVHHALQHRVTVTNPQHSRHKLQPTREVGALICQIWLQDWDRTLGRVPGAIGHWNQLQGSCTAIFEARRRAARGERSQTGSVRFWLQW